MALLVDDTLALRSQDRPEGDNAEQTFSLRLLVEVTTQLQTHSIDSRVLRTADDVQADLVVLVGQQDSQQPFGFGFGVPVVTAGSPSTAPPHGVAGAVLLDHDGMTQTTLEHLDGAGYRSIALIVPDFPLTHVAAVIESYQGWCRDHDGRCEVLTHSGTEASARAAAFAAAQQSDVTGIYTLSNTAGVLAGIAQADRSVGIDLGLVSRAEGMLESRLTPPVTSVSMCARESATAVVDVIRRIRRDGPPISRGGIRITAPYELTPRASTSPRWP